MKFSIVTPSFNSARYIREAIHSIISQRGDFAIEYFIVDNCSTDGTQKIVEEFKERLKTGSLPLGCQHVELNFVTERDEGMYDAINKGFKMATGDIFAWLNADDVYLPGALGTVAKVFANNGDIHWLKGITSYITEETLIWETGSCLLYTQEWIKAGIYGRDHYFIQQDSVFWRAWLWKKCGGIDARFKRAGDYYLWVKFSESAPLITVNSLLSCFRSVKGQLSEDIRAYRNEIKSFSAGEDALRNKVRLYFRFEKRLPLWIRPHIFRLVFGRPEFSVVLIDAKGEMVRITGQYYKVLSDLC